MSQNLRPSFRSVLELFAKWISSRANHPRQFLRIHSRRLQFSAVESPYRNVYVICERSCISPSSCVLESELEHISILNAIFVMQQKNATLHNRSNEPNKTISEELCTSDGSTSLESSLTTFRDSGRRYYGRLMAWNEITAFSYHACLTSRWPSCGYTTSEIVYLNSILEISYNQLVHFEIEPKIWLVKGDS
jgi:hypothetical protein